MNTPAHLLLGAAVFARPGRARVPLAAVLGSLAPDLSLYLMVSVSIWILGIPSSRVFDELYFSDAWQAVFAIDNSFPLWGLALGIALWRRNQAWTAFCAAALLHLAFDFPLHHDDARRMFWPLSDWVFHSPFSYWDSRHHGKLIAPLEMALAIFCAVVLWRRFPSLTARALTLVALAAEVLPGFLFRYIL